MSAPPLRFNAPSWQCRAASLFTRLVVRRRDWGEGQALARRSRRLFGAPPALQRLALRGLAHELVAAPGGVHGEWIVPANGTAGIVLYLHGGGYVSCSAATHRPITAALARLTGCAVFAADYRLAPESPFPAAFDDALATYQWLTSGGTPTVPIAVAGESAGGGLALALVQHVRDAGWPAPACVAAFSPWTDLAGTGKSRETNARRCAMFYPENAEAFASCYLAGASREDPRASPLYGDWRHLPPILLQAGSTELLLDDAVRVRDRIGSAGGECALTIYHDVPHGWHFFTQLMPEAQSALQEAADFIGGHLHGHRDDARQTSAFHWRG